LVVVVVVVVVFVVVTVVVLSVCVCFNHFSAFLLWFGLVVLYNFILIIDVIAMIIKQPLLLLLSLYYCVS